MKYKNFGEFLREKRIESGISLRNLAKRLNISPAFLSDVENDHRNPFELKRLLLLSDILLLNKDDSNKMFDLAGEKRHSIPPDVEEYIMENEFLIPVLRDLHDAEVTKDDMDTFLSHLRKR